MNLEKCSCLFTQLINIQALTVTNVGETLTSSTQLFDSLLRLPGRTGLPSTKNGRRPSLLIRNSPDARNFSTPWRLDIFQAGPSSDRSMSTVAQAVLLPNVTYNKRVSEERLNIQLWCLTSLERMRYLTNLPRRTASVCASKSGGLMPVTASTRTCQRPTSFSSCLISVFAKLRKKNH